MSAIFQVSGHTLFSKDQFFQIMYMSDQNLICCVQLLKVDFGSYDTSHNAKDSSIFKCLRELAISFLSSFKHTS